MQAEAQGGVEFRSSPIYRTRLLELASGARERFRQLIGCGDTKVCCCRRASSSWLFSAFSPSCLIDVESRQSRREIRDVVGAT
jgi:hypothetical protein